MAEEEKEDPLLMLLEGAIVVDEAIAKDPTLPCTCIRTDDKELCWHAGLIGTLSPSQRGPVGQPGPYCPTKIYKESPRLKERLEKFREAVQECKGIALGPERYKCLSQAFEKREIKV